MVNDKHLDNMRIGFRQLIVLMTNSNDKRKRNREFSLEEFWLA